MQEAGEQWFHGTQRNRLVVTEQDTASPASERVSGVEPPRLPWEGSALPVSYTRLCF